MSKFDITKSWLGSDLFVKRAIAIWAYALCGYILIALSFFAVMLVFALIATVLGSF
jgi:hypothetical protein